MRKRAIILILVGVLLSIAGGVGTFRYTQALEHEAGTVRATLAALGEAVETPVLREDKPRGAQVSAADFMTIKLPASYMPPDTMLTVPEIAEGGAMVALRHLKKGALLPNGALAHAGSFPDLGFLPAEGHAAFGVTVNNFAQIAPVLRQGSLVDLVWTRSLGGGATETRLLGSGLTVVALPETGGAGPAGQLILEGLPQAAIQQVAAQQSGSFDVLLSGGKLDEAMNRFVVGPNELKMLPQVIGDAPLAAASDGGFVSRLSGEDTRGKRCNTAVVRAGNRTVVDLPC